MYSKYHHIRNQLKLNVAARYNGRHLITGSNDKTIRMWNPETGVCFKVMTGHKDLVRTMVLDGVRQTVFSGSYDKRYIMSIGSLRHYADNG